MPETYTLRLVINHDDNQYTAKWIETDGQETEKFDLVLPLSSDDMDELRWYLETYIQFPGVGDRKRAEGIESQMADWGKSLFDAVFDTSEGANIYRNLMDRAKAGDRCLLTLGTTNPAVLGQPWEMMRDTRGPLAFRGVTVRRQLQGAKSHKTPPLKLPLRVLLIVSRPSDVGFIDPRNSIPPILDALEHLPEGQVEVIFCDPPTLPRLEEIISEARDADRPFHIVHFDGHGTYLPNTGVGALCFENASAKNTLVTGTELGDLLSRLDVPLVLLEACRTSDLSDKPVFGSVAPALLQSGVGSVVAFSHAVHIRAAQILVERFYQRLASGKTVGHAIDEARARLRADKARYLHLGPDAETVDLQDWFIPQLYQVGPDPALVFDGDEKPATVPRPDVHARIRKQMHGGFPPPPMYRFHGRALELLELERVFRKYPAVVVSGMGGMGKTALAREAAAWWIRTGRFESAVFVSFEQKAGAEQVVQVLGNALEESFSSRTAQDQWDTATDLFRNRRVLLVWDNFESTLPVYQNEENARKTDFRNSRKNDFRTPLEFGAEDRALLAKLFRDLTQGIPKGRLLVTCRPQETGLPGIREFPLKGLAHPDALHMLAAILDMKGIDKERDGYGRHEIDRLLGSLDCHPLSVELVSPHLKTLTPKEIREQFGKLLDKFADASAFEGRNRSLLASLAFSGSRLSPETREILPWLAWFQRGVFEQFLLDFTQLRPEQWEPMRAELTATALVSAEEDGIQINNRPYLRFHPTLPYAAKYADVPDPEQAGERFVAVYGQVGGTAYNALQGNQPAAGMALMAREEANLRRAIRLAFDRGDAHGAWSMADTLQLYLERAGRLRERAGLTAWVRDNLPEGDLNAASCGATREHAWSLFTQGQAAEAVKITQDLITRLETEGMPDAGELQTQLAISRLYLGRMYYSAGRADLALAPLQATIDGFEQLGEGQKGNLAAALGDLANANMSLGRFDQALEAAERGLAIDREMGRDREVATGLTQIAQILMEQHRHAEADARYEEALGAANAAGDLELQGAILQHRGDLQRRLGNQGRAVDLYKQAITLFQRATDPGGEMQTCDLLASAEMQRGQLDAAEAWYARARELAVRLGDQRQLAIIAQNRGILFQTRAEAVENDHSARDEYLRKAVYSVGESLKIVLEMQNQVGAASSYSQLGVLHGMLGELDKAERNAMKALEIRESLNHPDVSKDYWSLAQIARNRNDPEAAARWQAKYEAKKAELDRLARGEGAEQQPGMPDQIKALFKALAQAAYTARTNNAKLDPQAAEALAQLAQLPPPLNEIGAFLQAVADGKPLPPVPDNLPPDMAELLKGLAAAV